MEDPMTQTWEGLTLVKALTQSSLLSLLHAISRIVNGLWDEWKILPINYWTRRMTKSVGDETGITRLCSRGTVDVLPDVIRRLREADDTEPEKTLSDLRFMIWVQNCNNHFEAKHGMTIDEACFKLIEKGNYQPVLKHIVALGELWSELPDDSEATRFLTAYINKFLDAMDSRDKQQE
jgi:hypothetical protein